MKKQKKKFKILSLNTSKAKGQKKEPVKEVTFLEQNGIKDDAHSAPGTRQVSLLAFEEFNDDSLKYGDFAENITTSGVDLTNLKIGDRIHIDDTVLEISQHGKECHDRCEIYERLGDCVMPKKGVFAKVIKGGRVSIESSCYYNI